MIKHKLIAPRNLMTGTYDVTVKSVKQDPETGKVVVTIQMPTRPPPVKSNDAYRACNGLHAWIKTRVPKWIELHDQGRGLSVYQIGELDGVSEQTVRKKLVAAGVYKKSDRGWRKPESQAPKNHR